MKNFGLFNLIVLISMSFQGCLKSTSKVAVGEDDSCSEQEITYAAPSNLMAVADGEGSIVASFARAKSEICGQTTEGTNYLISLANQSCPAEDAIDLVVLDEVETAEATASLDLLKNDLDQLFVNVVSIEFGFCASVQIPVSDDPVSDEPIVETPLFKIPLMPNEPSTDNGTDDADESSGKLIPEAAF